MTTKQSVAALLGLSPDTHWDDIWASHVWFRSQPKGLGLDHLSEFSNGELDSGVHVMQTLAQVVGQEGRWAMEDKGYEIVVIRGPKSLADTGDVEGWTLPRGKGEIIGRFDFDLLAREYDE